MSKIKLLAFDADDTLWHHESYVQDAWEAMHKLMQKYGHFPEASSLANARHIDNLKLWGFGVKSITLSMIEAAIAMTQGRITGEDIQAIIDIGKRLYLHPIILLDHVAETLDDLSKKYPLILITKGDLWAQEVKLQQSGLQKFFKHVEVVSDKDIHTYQRIFQEQNMDPRDAVMVGNSVKSDILPLLALGAQAVHIPYYVTWQFEKAEVAENEQKRFVLLPSMRNLPGLLDKYEQSDARLLVDVMASHTMEI
ncbi:MAG TPA: HAD family hydrolase [Alphaproteobacteria bacterium]